MNIPVDKVRRFANDFAYNFVTRNSVSEEFRDLTGADMSEVMRGLENTLFLDLQDWLEEQLDGEEEG